MMEGHCIFAVLKSITTTNDFPACATVHLITDNHFT